MNGWLVSYVWLSCTAKTSAHSDANKKQLLDSMQYFTDIKQHVFVKGLFQIQGGIISYIDFCDCSIRAF